MAFSIQGYMINRYYFETNGSINLKTKTGNCNFPGFLNVGSFGLLLETQGTMLL